MNKRHENQQMLKNYQNLVAEGLRKIFPGENNIRVEWTAMLHGDIARFFSQSQSSQKQMYSPRIDIAVGPFATESQYIDTYDELMDSSHLFIHEMLVNHNQNIRGFGGSSHPPQLTRNRNARCFLAFEIERGNYASKYLMGSAVNAAALGRIGVFVAWHEDRLKEFLKIREYLLYLGKRRKNTFDTSNLLILSKEQLQQCIEIHCGFDLPQPK